MTPDVAGTLESVARAVSGFATRGRSHHQRVERVPCRVTVSGVRGKSTAVRWLNDALVERGFETYAKVTGDRPRSFRNRDAHAIERDDVVRLYENQRQLREFWPVEAVVAENQGIREYTTRLANELFDPQVVVVLNVRRDHQSTLGSDLGDIARSFARSVPDGAHVVSGDRNDAVNEYLRRELDRRGNPFSVARPRHGSPIADELGARTALAVDETLRVLGLDPLDADTLTEWVGELHDAWTWNRLACGDLVCDGSVLNDIESTELLRQHLVGQLDATTVTPFVFLRRDRAGRTAAFVEYADWLVDNGLAERIHVAGSHVRVFQRRTDVEVVRHDHERDDAGAVLDACLADGHPVYVMGNTVAEFMRDLDDAIDRRAVDQRATERRAADGSNPGGQA